MTQTSEDKETAMAEIARLEFEVCQAAIKRRETERDYHQAGLDSSFADDPSLSLEERVELSANQIRELDQRFGWSDCVGAFDSAVDALIAARKKVEPEVLYPKSDLPPEMFERNPILQGEE